MQAHLCLFKASTMRWPCTQAQVQQQDPKALFAGSTYANAATGLSVSDLSPQPTSGKACMPCLARVPCLAVSCLQRSTCVLCGLRTLSCERTELDRDLRCASLCVCPQARVPARLAWLWVSVWVLDVPYSLLWWLLCCTSVASSKKSPLRLATIRLCHPLPKHQGADQTGTCTIVWTCLQVYVHAQPPVPGAMVCTSQAYVVRFFALRTPSWYSISMRTITTICICVVLYGPCMANPMPGNTTVVLQ